MKKHIDRRVAPSLHSKRARSTDPNGPLPSLVEQLHDPLYALFLLKNGSAAPTKQAEFLDRMVGFLKDFERAAGKRGTPAEDVASVIYAVCAATDEVVQRARFVSDDGLEAFSLILTVCRGEGAGHKFFERLEHLRAKGKAHLSVLEVYHMCLLLGFEGKYRLGGSDTLHNLIVRVGEEILRMKGKSAGFAPHAERPDNVVNRVGPDRTLWVACAVFVLFGLVAYAGLRISLEREARTMLAKYNKVIEPLQAPANVTITLP